MRIDIILPHKEIFSRDKASSVSLTIKNSSEYSKFKSNIYIFGQNTDKPFDGLNFIGLKINELLHFGSNRSVKSNYFNYCKKNISENKIIEIHNRPYIFNIAIQREKKNPITLHFHNDPRDMKGSKTIRERIFTAKNASAVYFVSESIKKCFLNGINERFDNLYVIPNGIQRVINKKPIKKKEIIFIGRLVHEKGCHLYVNAIKDLAKKYSDWKFKIIGTPKAGQKKLSSSYSKTIIDQFISLGPNTEYLGFVSNDKVNKILQQTSIVVVPSIWQEPFGLTALEGLCNGAAVIGSKVGGMEEVISDIGILIDNIDAIKLRDSIQLLIKNQKLLKEYQSKSWENYHFNQKDIVKIQDAIRNQILVNYNY